MIKKYQEDFRQRPGTDPAVLSALDAIAAGMSGAQARGQQLWRQPQFEQSREKPAPLAHRPLVYVVTDNACASACLDALDLWKAMGAVHVGRQTSADTVYMDIRTVALPSGLSELSFPMKVYRDRRRGHNEPVTPKHLFPGDTSNVAPLKDWLARLHRGKP